MLNISSWITPQAPVHAQKTVTISIKDFGAKGNGTTNDHDAFVAAAQYINQRKSNVILTIPHGTYLIGKQQPGKEWMLEGVNALLLENVSNVQIVGQLKNKRPPLIKYVDGLYYGSFTRNANNTYIPKCQPAKNYYDKNTCAMIGAFFASINCSSIIVRDLEIDGNQEKMNIGGAYGDVGRQLNHRGFYLIRSNNITLQNIHVHHMGLDGIEVTGSNNTTLINVKSQYNGRQGLSWVDGNGLIATHCDFSYTGNSRIASPPCAGVDIEPEAGRDILNGTFKNCTMIGNIGCAVVNDRNKHLAQNVTFEQCEFVGLYNWALWVHGKNFVFKECNIIGQIAHTVRNNDVNKAEDITRFVQCEFSNVYKGRKIKPLSPYLIEANNEKMILENSTVKAFDIGFMWHSNGDKRAGLMSKALSTEFYTNNTTNYHCSTSGILFDNCSFYYTQGVNMNLYDAPKEKNKFFPSSKAEIDMRMKAKSILPASENTISNYICN
jgi:hypothetical protein